MNEIRLYLTLTHGLVANEFSARGKQTEARY